MFIILKIEVLEKNAIRKYNFLRLLKTIFRETLQQKKKEEKKL